MKQLSLILFLITGLGLFGQNPGSPIEGSVTYVTTQNVYVKFTSTDGIKQGDTLYFQQGLNLVPGLIVKDLSSISCVCIALGNITFKVNDKILSNQSSQKGPSKTLPSATTTPTSENITTAKQDTSSNSASNKYKRKQLIHGFVNVASNSDFSSQPALNLHSERLTFSFSAKDMGGSNLSLEWYFSYIQNDQQINEVPNSIFNKLKIYDFALIYDFGKRATLSLGRKLNPKLSNMGANDGLQFELKFKPISIGIIAGTRPAYSDYGFNSSLLQGGFYLFNEVDGKKGFMQTTLAFINQTNAGKTDRRFLYLQHINSLAKNLTFFGSLEADIFGKTFNSVDSTFKSNTNPKLTNLYLSLSYRFLKHVGI